MVREISWEQLQRVADVLKVISHPIRLEVIEILEKNQKMCVNHIMEALSHEIDQPMLSHHLIKMKDKGVLRSHKEGKYIYYSLVDAKILKIFDCLDSCGVIK